MKLRCAFIFLGVLLMTAACGRSFESPPPVPPQVVIDSVMPDKAYAGQKVTLIGQEFDPEAAKNEVYFGTELAEVLAVKDMEDGMLGLSVLVPLLDEKSVDIRVSTTNSQGSLEQLFIYLGPGHLVHQQIFEAVSFPATPMLAATIPGLDTLELFDWPSLMLLGLDNKTLSCANHETGLRYEVGLCETPLSGAVALEMDVNGGVVHYLITSLQVSDSGAPNSTRLQHMMVDSNGFHGPEVVEDIVPTDNDFLPLLIYAFCQSGNCLDQAFFVTDSQRPRGLIHDPKTNTSKLVLPSLTQMDSCDCEVDDPPSRILGLAQDMDDGALFTLPDQGPWIWLIDPSDDEPEATCAWPAPCPSQDIMSDCCNANYIALAARQNTSSEQPPEDAFRLYALDVVSSMVHEFKRVPDSGTLEFTGNRAGPFPGAFALTFGRHGAQAPITHEPFVAGRLYVATPNGIFILASNLHGSLSRVGFLLVPTDYDVPQALTTIKHWSIDAIGGPDTWPADILVYADPAGDRYFTFEAGRESSTLQEFPVGRQSPGMTAAGDGSVFYLTEPLHNSMRVIDNASQLQLREFKVHPSLWLGSGSPVYLSGKIDLLLLGLADPLENHLSAVAAWQPDQGLLGLPDCETSRLQPTEVPIINLPFHQMKLLHSDPEQLAFIHYGTVNAQNEPTVPASVRFLELNSQGEDATEVLNGPTEDLDPGWSACSVWLSLDPLGRASVVLDAMANPNNPDDWIAWLKIVDREQGPLDEPIVLDLSELAATADMALLVDENDQGLSNYTIFLSQVYYAGLLAIHVAGPSVTRHFIPTGGFPGLLTFSPDTKKLYVAHRGIGQLSVVNLDCPHYPQCAQVERTIDLDAVPSGLTSSASGAHLYVMHADKNQVTILE
ncbi:MAG: hypothetical protein JRF33_24655 [Deltaproteobacteria bacterium]|nr:hypothetical protein [Deltaproteobacteria bacterium]